MNFGFSFCREIFCWEIGNVKVSWIFNIGRYRALPKKNERISIPPPNIYALGICLPTLHAFAMFMRFTDAKVERRRREEGREPGTGVEGDEGGRIVSLLK